MVLRQHKGQVIESIVTEGALLRALAQAHMPVPEPLLLPTEEMPSLVLSFVEGTTEVEPSALTSSLMQMADFLVCLHSMPLESLGLPALPTLMDPVLAMEPYLSTLEEVFPVRAWLDSKPVRPALVNAVLLHGDFWPGNVLWQDGQLVAVIDWEDAALGDPLLDLAVSRQELLWKHGEAAMESFTAHYFQGQGEVFDLVRLAWWELLAGARALEWMSSWGLEAGQEAHMREVTKGWLMRAAGLVGVRQ